MDQHQTAQNTKNGIFSNLAKEETEVVSEPLKSEVKEVVRNYSPDQVKTELSKGEKISNFEGQVSLAIGDGLEWLEVDSDVLVMICKGDYPESGYHSYKGIKVCEKGKREEIEERDNMTAYDKANRIKR